MSEVIEYEQSVSGFGGACRVWAHVRSVRWMVIRRRSEGTRILAGYRQTIPATVSVAGG